MNLKDFKLKEYWYLYYLGIGGIYSLIILILQANLDIPTDPINFIAKVLLWPIFIFRLIMRI